MYILVRRWVSWNIRCNQDALYIRRWVSWYIRCKQDSLYIRRWVSWWVRCNVRLLVHKEVGQLMGKV